MIIIYNILILILSIFKFWISAKTREILKGMHTMAAKRLRIADLDYSVANVK